MPNRRTAGLTALVLTLSAGAVSGQAKPQGAPAAKPAAMTASDSIIAREKSIYDAITKKDFAAFNKILGADFVYVDGAGPIKWELAKSAEILKAAPPCKWSLKDMKATPVGSDLMVLSYTVSGGQTCNGQTAPPPNYSLSVWQRRAGSWVAIAHSETLVNPPAATK